MYIARLADGYIVKRMPETGDRHAPDCPSYEPPAELSGVRPLLGTAIREDPGTGLTMLKLGFSLSRRPGRANSPTSTSAHNTVSSSSARLSLRALLHYLWDQAELTRWHPGFEGRRTWGAIRHQLIRAATHMYACGDTLAAKLDVPEPFSVEQRDSINERRKNTWSAAASAAARTGSQAMLLLVAEVKAIQAARFGHKVIIKHMPDLSLSLNESTRQQIERRFERELVLWSAAHGVHLIMIATVCIDVAGLPRVVELSLMTVTQHWLPVENAFEIELMHGLVKNRRSFSRTLRYDLPASARIPSLVLTDEPGAAVAVFIAASSAPQSHARRELVTTAAHIPPAKSLETPLHTAA